MSERSTSPTIRRRKQNSENSYSTPPILSSVKQQPGTVLNNGQQDVPSPLDRPFLDVLQQQQQQHHRFNSSPPSKRHKRMHSDVSPPPNAGPSSHQPSEGAVNLSMSSPPRLVIPKLEGSADEDTQNCLRSIITTAKFAMAAEHHTSDSEVSFMRISLSITMNVQCPCM